jgi:hypothetical protein
MSTATKNHSKESPTGKQAVNAGSKGKGATATAKEASITECIENIGARERVEIPDDGRSLLVSRLSFPR